MFLACVIFLLFVLLFFDDTSFIIPFLIVSLFFIIWSIYIFTRKTKERTSYQKYRKYFEVEKNVNNFNFTIDEIEALLNSPKASKKLPDGKQILEVLDTIRGDLVSALKLERLYRENPNYKYDRKLNVDLTSDDHFMELINRNDIQGSEMNELLTKWQEIREAINNM